MARTETADSSWNGLYKAGGVAALIVVLLEVCEITLTIFHPQPSTVIGWFTLFQSNRIIGLLDFWGWEVPMYVDFAIVFLALYAALRKVDESRMAIATTLALLGVGVFLATTNPFSMLSLSNQYVASTTDAQRSVFLAAGQAFLTNTNQRALGGFNMGLFLVSIGGLIVSWVMLRSGSFSRLTAYMGILTYVISLADYAREALAAPMAVALLVVFSYAVFAGSWFLLVGRRLIQLGQAGEK